VGLEDSAADYLLLGGTHRRAGGVDAPSVSARVTFPFVLAIVLPYLSVSETWYTSYDGRSYTL